MKVFLKSILKALGIKKQSLDSERAIEGTTTIDGKPPHSHTFMSIKGIGLTADTIGEGPPHVHVLIDDNILPGGDDDHPHSIATSFEKLTREELGKAAMDYENEKVATENSLPGNPPEWVSDEAKWDQAKGISQDAHGEVRWPFVTWVYLNQLKGGTK